MSKQATITECGCGVPAEATPGRKAVAVDPDAKERNVKRLRPADLVPYRYASSQPTTWLWVSEGITSMCQW